MRITEFFDFMVMKIEDNSHKMHWQGCSNQYLSMRLTQEKQELMRAIKNNLSKEEICKEAADIANFAFMIADNYEEQDLSK